FFMNSRSIVAVAGGDPGRLGYGTEVKALRITITVRRGLSSFRLAAVVAPEGGAKTVATSASPTPDGNTPGNPDADSDSPLASSSQPATAVPEVVDLKYPFTFLEIRENDSAV